MEYKWTALTVTLVGTIMTGINSRIVVVGLPTIARELHAGPDLLIWVTQSYVLSSTIGLLLVGRITDILGRVKMYNIGFAIFTLGSALSSISLDTYQLIAFRTVQGFGSAMLLTNSAAIVTDASPVKDLGTMLGINQSGIRLGSMSGLTLSGIILSFVDWRGLFYVNIPIGIFGTLWAHKRLREISAKDPARKMDWVGFGLITGALTFAMVSITFLSYGLAGSEEGVAFLACGLVMLVAFIRVESKSASPFLDLGLFRIRLFAAGNLAQLLNAVAWSGASLLFAFYLQIGLGYTPLQAGLGIVPVEFAFLISTIGGGKLSDKYGTRVLATIGLAIVFVSFLFAATFGALTNYIEVALVLAALGIGEGLFTSPNSKSVMMSVPPIRRGIASAFRSLMFNIGFTISYGLIILFITFGIPYSNFSELLQGTMQQASIAAARLEFLSGYRIAALFLGIMDAAAIIPSFMREKSRGEKVVKETRTSDEHSD